MVGGMFSNHFITQSTLVKNFENRSIYDKDMNKTLWLSFLGHPVMLEKARPYETV